MDRLLCSSRPTYSNAPGHSSPFVVEWAAWNDEKISKIWPENPVRTPRMKTNMRICDSQSHQWTLTYHKFLTLSDSVQRRHNNLSIILHFFEHWGDTFSPFNLQETPTPALFLNSLADYLEIERRRFLIFFLTFEWVAKYWGKFA